jgi:adenylate cyclase
MTYLRKYWQRISVTLLPLLIALLHTLGVLQIGLLDRLDNVIFDARLRATMPNTLDERVVIIDIDEKSLAQLGRWPWGRHHMASMMDELFDRQRVAVVGFDVVFAEPDDSSGLKKLRSLAENELRGESGFVSLLPQLQGQLDYDAAFARSIKDRPVVMGYYLTSDRDGGKSGRLPEPVFDTVALNGKSVGITSWNGFGSNIDQLAQAAPLAGYFNPIPDSDGVVRSLPMIAEYQGKYYESLALAMFRVLAGMPEVALGISNAQADANNRLIMESVRLHQGQSSFTIPVDERAATLVPYRGNGGAKGGSFQYISAFELISGSLPENALRDKIVLVGTTAPGLQDLRVTPVGEAYPGVEAHANMISGLLDSRLPVKPDYAAGYEVLVLMVTGLLLALALPTLSATNAVMLSVVVVALPVGLNFWLFQNYSLVLPLASAIASTTTAFALNMSYGYFVESRSKRDLANLFGTYVPPELVDEMVKDPDRYSMKATNRELTVMFCDMRGFTKMSEHMEPIALQELLNGVFSRLTQLIRAQRGTIDKYMGDCVMAFWGAPVASPDHASLAVRAAIDMAHIVKVINEEHQARGLPEIGIGIGLNSGSMCVGDMGSDIRRSYTVIGDAVNLGSRLEGLSKVYGVDMVVSESTHQLTSGQAWQELDKVRVKGKEQAVTIYYPMGAEQDLSEMVKEELAIWRSFLDAYRSQNWDDAQAGIRQLLKLNPDKYLYHVYAERIASMRLLPFDPAWDGATNFETK